MFMLHRSNTLSLCFLFSFLWLCLPSCFFVLCSSFFPLVSLFFVFLSSLVFLWLCLLSSLLFLWLCLLSSFLFLWLCLLFFPLVSLFFVFFLPSFFFDFVFFLLSCFFVLCFSFSQKMHSLFDSYRLSTRWLMFFFIWTFLSSFFKVVLFLSLSIVCLFSTCLCTGTLDS
jgi:hypothetical protein